MSPTQARANSPARVTITLRLAACKWLIAAEAVDCPSTTTGTGSIPEGLLSHDNIAGPVAVLIGLDQSVGDKLRSSSPDISAAVEELVDDDLSAVDDDLDDATELVEAPDAAIAEDAAQELADQPEIPANQDATGDVQAETAGENAEASSDEQSGSASTDE